MVWSLRVSTALSSPTDVPGYHNFFDLKPLEGTVFGMTAGAASLVFFVVGLAVPPLFNLESFLVREGFPLWWPKVVQESKVVTAKKTTETKSVQNAVSAISNLKSVLKWIATHSIFPWFQPHRRTHPDYYVFFNPLSSLCLSPYCVQPISPRGMTFSLVLSG